jgi:hypothetical protein
MEDNNNDDQNDNNEAIIETDVDPTRLAVIVKDDNITNNPDLKNEKLKSKHRKHTRYKYSNQPNRFKNDSHNVTCSIWTCIGQYY